jgi:hypothetical protein
MSPIDPKESAPDPKPPMAPPYVDENPNQASVEDGLEVADEEIRETVADAYEATAKERGADEEILESPVLTGEPASEDAPETSAVRPAEPGP